MREAQGADAFFVRDVLPSDAISADGPFGDAPPGVADSGACVGSLSFCSGACVDLQSDQGNCGACDTACTGACVTGRCLLTLASDQGAPAGVTVTASFVYWTDEGTAAESNGRVLQIPKVGVMDGGPTNVVASGQGSPFGLAIAAGATSVYWTTETAGTVMGASIADGGGAATPSRSPPARASRPRSATGASRLYWANAGGADAGGSIVALGLVDGGVVVTLAQGQKSPTALALFDGGLAWGGENGVTSLALVDGGVPYVLASGTATAIAADATNVYWTSLGTAAANEYTDGTVLQMPRAGGAVVTLATAQTIGTAIVVDGTNVYWTAQATGVGGGTS